MFFYYLTHTKHKTFGESSTQEQQWQNLNGKYGKNPQSLGGKKRWGRKKLQTEVEKSLASVN